VLVNARAGGVRRDPGAVERIRRRLPSDRLRLTGDMSEIEEALTELLSAGVDTLVIVGGDGTAGGTLTALARMLPPERLPRVVLAGGGTISTIAKSLGARKRPDVNLTRWLSVHEPSLQTTRPLIRVTPRYGEPSYGMIFGNGALCRWLEHYYRTPGGAMAASRLITQSIGSVLLGGPLARQIFDPIPGVISLDDEPERELAFTALAGSSVEDIGLGFRPFHTAGQAPDRFHWIETDSTGRQMSLELPGQFFGRNRPGSRLRHASPSRVRLRTERPLSYMIDADLFEPTPELRIEAGPPVRFAQA
jgi:diacylglycerol kinase family enzyme